MKYYMRFLILMDMNTMSRNEASAPSQKKNA